MLREMNLCILLYSLNFYKFLCNNLWSECNFSIVVLCLKEMEMTFPIYKIKVSS